MPHADELEPVTPAIALWRCYDPTVKADLFSTALQTSAGVVLVDPIPLAEKAVPSLQRLGPIWGVVITNANHVRAADQFAERFAVPIFAHRDSFQESRPISFHPIADGERICDALNAIAIDGAAPGEIALYHDTNGGTLVLGDALIHCEPYGFALLPPKYCTNAKKMKLSLGKLLPCDAGRILFAHGLPILSLATERLRALLDS